MYTLKRVTHTRDHDRAVSIRERERIAAEIVQGQHTQGAGRAAPSTSDFIGLQGWVIWRIR
jgi:hypothetical protein